MEQQNNKTFKMLTHNMWCHYITGAPNKFQRIKTFVQELQNNNNNFDVILLQELFIINIFGFWAGNELRNYLFEELAKLGYIHQVQGNKPPWVFGQTSGLLIFSKHPIVKIFEEKRWYRLDDFGTGKGYLHVIIKIFEEEIHFFNVHLDAHWKEARELQLLSLTSDLPFDHSSKVIVAGDYNINQGDKEEYKTMMGHFEGKEMRNLFDGEFVVTHLKHDIHIDHIVATNNLRVVSKQIERFKDEKGEHVSDHVGISATFSFV